MSCERTGFAEAAAVDHPGSAERLPLGSAGRSPRGRRCPAGRRPHSCAGSAEFALLGRSLPERRARRSAGSGEFVVLGSGVADRRPCRCAGSPGFVLLGGSLAGRRRRAGPGESVLLGCGLAACRRRCAGSADAEPLDRPSPPAQPKAVAGT
jgi:hypothetical protein